jgi:hypothetical protein
MPNHAIVTIFNYNFPIIDVFLNFEFLNWDWWENLIMSTKENKEPTNMHTWMWKMCSTNGIFFEVMI